LQQDYSFCSSLQVVPAASSAVSKAGRNAAVTSLMVCCGFIVCWTPNGIAFFLNFVGYAIDFSGWLYHSTKIYVYSNDSYTFLFTGM